VRIALFNIFIPFVRGGAEILVDDLGEQLKEHGHEVILFRLPFPQSYEAPLVATIEASRMLCFDEFDRVIAFKFPAYCVKHHARVMWMFHQFRQVYELWGGEFGLQVNPVSESIRKIVMAADNEDIPRSRHIFVNSIEVSNRLKQFNHIDATVLMPPLKNHELYFNEKVGDYIYYPSRITPLKRQHLAIEAMQYVKSGVRLIVTGICGEDSYFEQLKMAIRDNNLDNRVELRNQWVSEEEKRQLIANALGIMYIPYKEDSCGFVSMEAFYSAKPVITCIDSGGTRELVENTINGLNVESTPQALAEAMDKLFDDQGLSERMGKAGLDDIIRRDITWPATIRRLLS
jgi:glycosyltransferase involved in cell wall biosynthesis